MIVKIPFIPYADNSQDSDKPKAQTPQPEQPAIAGQSNISKSNMAGEARLVDQSEQEAPKTRVMIQRETFNHSMHQISDYSKLRYDHLGHKHHYHFKSNAPHRNLTLKVAPRSMASLDRPLILLGSFNRVQRRRHI